MTLTSKFDIKDTDIVITDNEEVANTLRREGAQPKTLFYANRVALHDTILKLSNDSPIKVILRYYSGKTKKFITDNKIQAELIYPVGTEDIGLATDELEDMGGTTYPPIIHRYS